ncbi:hypothetical protein PVK06_018725 [Gossypium arboreum]|uniref:Uncharacterized protein n=1 Tax=Gossypium arboreum TaxID=29729 RepID=A0ABR0PHS1_GOSAR|nr:hypothetical protein PVK06_018725 [Gossypium arboreum]
MQDGGLRLNCRRDDSIVLEEQDHWNVEQVEPVGKGKAMRVKNQLGMEEGNGDKIKDGDEDEGDAGDEDNHKGGGEDKEDKDDGDDQVDEPRSHRQLLCGHGSGYKGEPIDGRHHYGCKRTLRRGGERLFGAVKVILLSV